MSYYKVSKRKARPPTVHNVIPPWETRGRPVIQSVKVREKEREAACLS